MPGTTALAYGATRAGKTHLLLTMAPLGRLVVSDAEGQIAAECPSAYTMVLPPPLLPTASPAEHEERARVRDARLAEARDAAVVIWPCYTPEHHNSLLGALRQRRLGDVTTVGVDSLTFLLEKLIAAICGVAIIHKKGKDGEVIEVQDPVLAAMPDFSGAGVHRSMEKQDWGRFAIKASEIVAATLALCDEFGYHCVMTALEVKRDLWEGEPGKSRFLGTQQGPLIQGRMAPAVIPPRFQFLLRCASMMLPQREKPVFAAYTVPADGWPAGVRGEAITTLPGIVDNPNLPAMLRRASLIP